MRMSDSVPARVNTSCEPIVVDMYLSVTVDAPGGRLKKNVTPFASVAVAFGSSFAPAA